METCCSNLKSTATLPGMSKGRFGNGEDGFWGERTRGSLNNFAWVNNHSAKSLRLGEKKMRKIKTGTVFSVLTTENGTEVMVCFNFFFIFTATIACHRCFLDICFFFFWIYNFRLSQHLYGIGEGGIPRMWPLSS